jgi:signal transduction histidine kinase
VVIPEPPSARRAAIAADEAGESARGEDAARRGGTSSDAPVELDRFVRMLAHELQNPLSAVTMLLSVLRRAPGLEEPFREHVDRGLEASSRMRRLIRGAVEFAVVGLRRRGFAEVDCGEVLRAAVAGLGGAGAGVRIERRGMPTVRGDRVELERLFRHLIDNGIRYSGTATPSVEITCDREGDVCRFRVVDQGVGIEPAEHERVFEPLQRLHGHDAVAGSGFGLALCKRVVESHGGRIGLESEPGRGTVVWFTLPVAAPPTA